MGDFTVGLKTISIIYKTQEQLSYAKFFLRQKFFYANIFLRQKFFCNQKKNFGVKNLPETRTLSDLSNPKLSIYI